MKNGVTYGDMSVFSKISECIRLTESARMRKNVPTQFKTAKELHKIAINRNVNEYDVPNWLILDYHENRIGDDNDITYEVCTNVELRKWLLWTWNRIFVPLNDISYYTVLVRIRIATSMLNKLQISKSLSIRIHANLVENLMQSHYQLTTEDLPF